MLPERAFALTGLTSRGGLRNWVFFFFPDRLVMIDVGLAPALKAGVQAGVLAQLGGQGLAEAGALEHGPQRPASVGLRAWCEELRGRAKGVVELADGELLSVQLTLKLMAHELRVTGGDGIGRRFGLLNRAQAEAAAGPLQERLGARFEIVKTPAFALVERHAPFLL